MVCQLESHVGYGKVTVECRCGAISTHGTNTEQIQTETEPLVFRAFIGRSEEVNKNIDDIQTRWTKA